MTTTRAIDKTASVLGWPELLSHLANFCETDRGKSYAVKHPFFQSSDEVIAEFDFVEEAVALHQKRDLYTLGGVFDIREALGRASKGGTLDGNSLREAGQTLAAGSRIRRHLRARIEDVPQLARIASGISELDHVSSTLLDAFDPNGALSDHASTELGRLRRRVLELHEQISRKMRALIEVPSVSKFLQDSFYTQREDRYVLPVRTDAGNAVDGIVHGFSSSGATMFIEPQEVTALNNQLKVAEVEVVREENRIFSELSSFLRDECTSILKNLDVLEHLDLIRAKACLAERIEANRPQISQKGDFRLYRMRHPLLVLSDVKVIENDLELSAQQCLVITGPNAGGKTVCLKTAGLLAFMLKAGLFVPASPDSEIPFYEELLTELGDDQSLTDHLSTFSAHIKNLLHFYTRAKTGVLLLLDEIGIGTDPLEGAALAQAILEAYVSKGAQVVVTTHFEKLKTLPLSDERFKNASVGYSLEKMGPTYKLHLGLPGTSGALDVAKRMGLSEELLTRTRNLLDGRGEEMAALVNQLNTEREKLEDQQRLLQKEIEKVQSQKTELEHAIQKQADQQRRLVEQGAKDALEDLRRTREELTRVRSLIKSNPTKERVTQAERQVSAIAQTILKHEPKKNLPGKPATLADLKTGSHVIIERLGGAGEVLEEPKRGKVMVRVGGVKTSVQIDEILIPTGTVGLKALEKEKTRESGPRVQKQNKSTENENSSSAEIDDGIHEVRTAVTLFRTPGNTLDVRGKRVDEALALSDAFLDNAFHHGETSAFIIHGHGTGALKSAIRELLSESPLVREFEAARREDGGDGVTAVIFK